jgi:hypothetical protein
MMGRVLIQPELFMFDGPMEWNRSLQVPNRKKRESITNCCYLIVIKLIDWRVLSCYPAKAVM